MDRKAADFWSLGLRDAFKEVPHTYANRGTFTGRSNGDARGGASPRRAAAEDGAPGCRLLGVRVVAAHNCHAGADHSDIEDAEHMAEHGTTPEEWRVWLADTPEARRVFDGVHRRMEDLIRKYANGSAHKGFVLEEPRVDQYFCTGDPRIGPKAATRDGKVEMEIKQLVGVSDKTVLDPGSECWEKATGVDMSPYTKLPWVSFQKTRNRCKAKQIVKGTRLEGLKALETTEIKVVDRCISSSASGPMQRFKSNSFLTIAVEGTSIAIHHALAEIHLLDVEAFVDQTISNSEGTGLYSLNVSYPRLIVIKSQENLKPLDAREVTAIDSDHEAAEHEAQHGSRPQEWRMWLRDTPESRQAFNAAHHRMKDLIWELAGKKLDVKSKGFTTEDPRIDQYFCTQDPRCGPKAATRDGQVEMEVKNLKACSDQGSELWEKATGVDLSQFTKLPWVALKKTRTRCKAKKIVKGTDFDGLKALESTGIEVVSTGVYPGATGGMQRLKDDSYLTLAVEGTPASIEKAVATLCLQDLAPYMIVAGVEGKGLYRYNVSYPRFISVASDMTRQDIPTGSKATNAALQRRMEVTAGILVSGAGTSSVNGSYRLVAGAAQGDRPVYEHTQTPNFKIQWSTLGNFWMVGNTDGENFDAPYLCSARADVTVPLDAEWDLYQGGLRPPPTVKEFAPSCSYVVMRVGSSELRTEAVANDRRAWKPREWTFPVMSDDQVLELEVFSTNEVLKEHSLGRTVVPIRHIRAGPWSKRTELLHEDGQLEFEVRLIRESASRAVMSTGKLGLSVGSSTSNPAAPLSPRPMSARGPPLPSSDNLHSVIGMRVEMHEATRRERIQEDQHRERKAAAERQITEQKRKESLDLRRNSAEDMRRKQDAQLREIADRSRMWKAQRDQQSNKDLNDRKQAKKDRDLHWKVEREVKKGQQERSKADERYDHMMEQKLEKDFRQKQAGDRFTSEREKRMQADDTADWRRRITQTISELQSSTPLPLTAVERGEDSPGFPHVLQSQPVL